MTTTSLIYARKIKAQTLALAHGMAADKAEKLTLRLGVPVIVLTTLVGTASFANLVDLGKSNIALALGTGALSIVAAVLAALQTFLNFHGKARAHAKAAAHLSSCARAYELILFTSGARQSAEFRKVDAELDRTIREAPRVSVAIQKRAGDEVENVRKLNAEARIRELPDVDRMLDIPRGPA
jgi:hypothetical protein